MRLPSVGSSMKEAEHPPPWAHTTLRSQLSATPPAPESPQAGTLRSSPLRVWSQTHIGTLTPPVPIWEPAQATPPTSQSLSSIICKMGMPVPASGGPRERDEVRGPAW